MSRQYIHSSICFELTFPYSNCFCYSADLIYSSNSTTVISYCEAKNNVQSHVQALAHLSVPFQEAVGFILADDVYASVDVPVFDQSVVEGYAFFQEEEHIILLPAQESYRFNSFATANYLVCLEENGSCIETENLFEAKRFPV